MHDEPAAALQAILKRSSRDDAFRRRLLADPAAVLRAEGLPLPAGVEVRALENGPNRVCLVLPQRPADLDLDDGALAAVAGGRPIFRKRIVP
jgi:hypothetical protein